MPAAKDQGLMDPRQRNDRRASKPLMEKRRRARINHCLSQLKSLVIDRTQNENSRQTKLEKADILELTVRYLQDMKRRRRTASLLSDSQEQQRFQIGFEECANEVDTFLSTFIGDGVQSELKQRLKSHLVNRIRDIQDSETTTNNSWKEQDDEIEMKHRNVDARLSSSSSSSAEFDTGIADQLMDSPDPLMDCASTSSTSNRWEAPRSQMQEVPLVPRRLPNGDFALILPPNVVSNGSCISCPLSAFRLVCNSWPSTANRTESPRRFKDREHSLSSSPSPPLSSTVSDLSADESNLADVESNSPRDSGNSMWRPW